MYQRILVPIDGSATAAAGLREAMKLAKAQGGKIRLVHVVDDAPAISPAIYGAVYEGVVSALRKAAASVLAAGVDQVRQDDVPVDSQLVEIIGGPAGEYIVKEAKAWSADLIVCGTHGRRGIRRLVMGSDAEYIVRHSPVPVLLIRGESE
ncbi:MAG TPA: universal stress protein [Steroidobacteraceae bacterium]|nr:universal stress protein [Steroidobacteraceae bacterium]